MTFNLGPGSRPGFTLVNLSDRLLTRGRQVSADTLPAERQDLVVRALGSPVKSP